MRIKSLCGAAVFWLFVGIGSTAFAQGGDVNGEVRRAVERAVEASVSSSVAESLSRSIVSEGLQLMPTTTVFGSPFYNRIDASFSFGSFKADTFGGVIGGLYKVNDVLLLHGAFSGAHTSTEVTAGGAKASVDAQFIEMRVGADLVFLNTQSVKGWFTLEGGVANFDTNVTDSIWSWRVSPSATLSLRGGPLLFEPTVAFSFSKTFEHEDSNAVVVFQPGFSLKYRGEKFRPQLNFSYARVIDPDTGDDGFISVGPEILYAVTPSLLVGGAYSYGTPLTKGISVNSHTVTLEVRWTF